MKDQFTNFSSILRSKKDLMTCIFLTLIIQISVAIGTIKYDQEHNILGDINIFTLLGIFIGVIFLIFMMLSNKISFTTKQFLFIPWRADCWWLFLKTICGKQFLFINPEVDW